MTDDELQCDVAQALTRALEGPVFITDGDAPTHVLLSMDQYRTLTRRRRNIADALASPDSAELEFAAPVVLIGSRPADFS